MPRKALSPLEVVKSIVENRRESYETADRPLRHLFDQLRYLNRVPDYVERHVSSDTVYANPFRNHMSLTRRMALVGSIEAFERFVKELAVLCADRLARYFRDDRFEHLLARGLVEDRVVAVGAHAAGVGTGVAVVSGLVVLGGAELEHALAVGQLHLQGLVLGEVVAAAEGEALFDVVEGVRREMVGLRESDTDAGREAALDRAADSLARLSLEEKTTFARAYTLYLQLVNVCENGYRTHRLRRRLRDPGTEPRGRARLTFVLTAHPTESRSPGNIRLLRRVQDHVVDSLERGRSLERREVENLIRLAWRVGTHPREQPTVEDEANHLFSLLTDPILAEVTALSEAGHRILFRTWVGGDRDGHPGVGPEQTGLALARSRELRAPRDPR